MVGLIRQQLIHINGRICRICCGPRKRRWVVRRLGAVLMSLEQAPDFTASRRLSMACRAVGRPLVLVLGAEAGQASTAATTRWQISAAPHNSWQVRLQRLRGSLNVHRPWQAGRFSRGAKPCPFLMILFPITRHLKACPCMPQPLRQLGWVLVSCHNPRHTCRLPAPALFSRP